MKNSLFKRAVAAVAAVPLALTQCLTYANAVSDGAVQETMNAQAVDEDALTLESVLYIPANETVSRWNNIATTLLATSTKRAGEIDLAPYVDRIIDKAGAYKADAEYVIKDLVLANGITYEITAENDIIIRGKVSEPDFNRKLSISAADKFNELAEKYNAPKLKAIDYSQVKVGGDFTVTIKASDFLMGTKFPVSFEYKNADGTFGLGELPAYATEKIEQLKKIGEDSIKEQIPAEYVDDALNELNAKFAGILDKLKKADNHIDKILGFEKSGAYANIAEVISDINAFYNAHKNDSRIPEKYAAHFQNNEVPATATDIVQTGMFQKVFAQILDKAESKVKVDISASDIGLMGDSITDISYTIANGNAVGFGKFPDAEQAQVKAWVESNGNVFVDSYKTIMAEVDFSGVKSPDLGYIDLQVERVVVTDTATTTTTTTTTTSATTTTEADTTTTEADDTTTTTSSVSTTTTSVTSAGPTNTTTSATTTAEDVTTTVSTTSVDVTSAGPTNTTTSATTTSEDITTTVSTTSSDVTSTESTTTTEDITTTESSTSSDVTSTETTTTTSATTTESTTSTTDTTSTTSTTGTDVTPVVTTSVVAEYVTAGISGGFYFSIDTEFDASMIKNPVLHTKYVAGYMKDGTLVITDENETTKNIDDISFGLATPANTYSAENSTFMYEIPVYSNGEVLKKEDGTDFTATVFIAPKGDVNLDNLVDASDASLILAYYANVSTNNGSVEGITLSSSELVASNPLLDNFAAFLADIDATVDRYSTKDNRRVDASDASYILSFYAKASSSSYEGMSPAEIWKTIIQ